jgi:thiaminase/transcriptional activator TenA
MRVAELVALHPQEWNAATSGPFLDAVRDGSLPDSAFRNWLSQDYLFVADLLRFQARLLSIAPRGGQHVLTDGLMALEAELTWFEGHAARSRVHLDAEHQSVTQAYRELLASYSENWRPGITALWTGERAYLDSWNRALPGAPAYRDFVSHWTHPDFAAYVARLALAVDLEGVDESAFLAVCALERDFWAMAWDSART